MEPLTSQPVAVQGKHTIEEGVPLLHREGPILTINQAQLVVQTGVSGAVLTNKVETAPTIAVTITISTRLMLFMSSHS